MAQHKLVLDSSKFREKRNAHLAEAFEPNPLSQSSAACRWENVRIIIPRFDATSAPNPMTVGGLPTTAMVGGMERI